MNTYGQKIMNRTCFDKAASIAALGLASVLAAGTFWALVESGVWLLEQLFPF